MNEHIEKKRGITVGYGPQGTVYREPYKQPSECLVEGVKNQNLSGLHSQVKSVLANPEEKAEQVKGLPNLNLETAQIGSLNIVSGKIGVAEFGGKVNVDEKGMISGFGLTSTAGNLVLNADEVKGPIVKIGDEYFVKSEFISNKPKNVKAVNVNYKPVEFNDDSPLLGYYNDGTGHLYSVAKLVELTKDLEPFDAPIQAFDLSPEIWRNCSMFELAYHVKLVNEANLDYPIILDWNGGIADGRHRLIKALVLGHSTIKCVRMTYKPNFDKTLD